MFDLASRQPLATLPAGADADAVAYDPASRRVFVINGGSGTITVVDPGGRRVLATIPLGGKLEFAAADGEGRLFVSQADPRAIARVDTATLTITARWPLPDCLSPHGMGFDARSRRIFTSCVDGCLVVVDASDGRLVATLPIGRGSDAVSVDPNRRLVFSSSGDGTLSVIRLLDGSHFGPTRSLQTQPGSRTTAVDPESGREFLVTADVASAGPPRLPGSSPGLHLRSRHRPPPRSPTLQATTPDIARQGREHPAASGPAGRQVHTAPGSIQEAPASLPRGAAAPAGRHGRTGAQGSICMPREELPRAGQDRAGVVRGRGARRLTPPPGSP